MDLLRRWRRLWRLLLSLGLSGWLRCQDGVRVRRRSGLGQHRIVLRHGLLVVYGLLAYGLLIHLLLSHGLLVHRGRLGHRLLLAHGLRVQRLLAHGLGVHRLRHMLLAHGRRQVVQRRRIARLRGHLSMRGRARTRARDRQLGLGLLGSSAILDVVVDW